MGERAVSYGNEKIPEEWGTAVNVQSMGLRNTGVRQRPVFAFTRILRPAKTVFGVLTRQGDVVRGSDAQPVNSGQPMNKHLHHGRE